VPSDVSLLLILGIASGVAFAVAELAVLRAAVRDGAARLPARKSRSEERRTRLSTF
jgi:hypothetical protein